MAVPTHSRLVPSEATEPDPVAVPIAAPSSRLGLTVVVEKGYQATKALSLPLGARLISLLTSAEVRASFQILRSRIEPLK